MKTNNLIIYLFLSLSMVSCYTQRDVDDYISGRIYIYQTAVNAGKVNAFYSVSSSSGESGRYEIEEDILHIGLEVAHEGEDSFPYEVEIVSDELLSESSAASLNEAVVLGTEFYSVPEKVSVPEGRKRTDFSLDVDLSKMNDAYGRNPDKTFVVSLRLQNPTDYELNPDRSAIVVLIDGKSFIEKKPLVFLSWEEASLLDGGMTNDFPIPFTSKPGTWHTFDDMSLSLSVPLHVRRTDEEDVIYEPFSASIVQDYTKSAEVASGMENAVAIPEGYSGLSETVVFDASTSEKEVTLYIDFERISADHPEFAGKKLVLSLLLSDPDKYELDPKLSCINIIIDADKFLYLPDPGNLLEGGRFSKRDASKWSIVNASSASEPVPEGQFFIAGDVLNLNISKAYNYTCSHAVDISEPGYYRMSLSFKGNGGAKAWSSRLYVILSENKPTAGVNYFTSYVQKAPHLVVDGTQISAATGTEVDLSSSYWSKKNGFPDNCEIEVKTSGRWWFVIGVSAWDWGLSNQPLVGYFDNARLEMVNKN